MQALGLVADPGGPSEQVATAKAEVERWGAVIRAANINAG